MARALDLVKQGLTDGLGRADGGGSNYSVPGLWSGSDRWSERHLVNPYNFYLDRIRWIESQEEERLVSGGPDGEWTQKAVIYNTLIRAATGWDHNGDGEINLDPVGDGWMETGTFLKTIAVLPLVKRMGFNTLHLLPVTAIGKDGHKGTLGSVYAIQNPYRLDPRLSEPVLGLKPEDEFAALIEAAHHLGLRVVLEFVFRTAARDADWVAEHPEWFYWILDVIPDRRPGQQDGDAYGAPIFSEEQLKTIKRRVERGSRENLIPPPDRYRDMFTAPPNPERIERVDGSWIGRLEDGTPVRIPGAFADWPPDDAQPPWTDVTYLRLYDHRDFNYIAYNTVRMYDARLARPENRVEDLWDRIIGILPNYQKQFGIDGVMIDMGHALPMPLKRRMVAAAREIDADFAFWDENFSITRQSREEGYNAVIGNYWWLAYRPEKLIEDMLRGCAESGYPIPFFAGPESHNTPRAAARPGGVPYARLVWAVGCLLPAIPFCHAGFELAETWPVNTGLDFDPEELSRYRADDLPLFSQAAYDWDNQPDLVDWIRAVLDVRARYADVVIDPDPFTFDLLESDNPKVWAVVRRRRLQAIGVVFNLSWDSPQTFSLRVPTGAHHLTDLLTGSEIALARGTLQASLEPAESLFFGW